MILRMCHTYHLIYHYSCIFLKPIVKSKWLDLPCTPVHRGMIFGILWGLSCRVCTTPRAHSGSWTCGQVSRDSSLDLCTMIKRCKNLPTKNPELLYVAVYEKHPVLVYLGMWSQNMFHVHHKVTITRFDENWSSHLWEITPDGHTHIRKDMPHFKIPLQ